MKFLSKISFFQKQDKRKIQMPEPDGMQERVRIDYQEYLLIQSKESNLPKKQRDLIAARINAYIALGYLKVLEDEK